jgi:isocitrate dehydrogenase kinase/phosphatase
MASELVLPDLAERGAALIARGFERYHREFLAISRRAKARFETRDWQGALADGRERLLLYNDVLQGVLAELQPLLGADVENAALWALMRSAHAREALGHPAGEISETFFNSVTRRVLQTVGTNPGVEYLDFRFERVPGPIATAQIRNFAAVPDAAAAVRALLDHVAFAAPWADREGDARRVGAAIARAWDEGEAPHGLETLEMLDPVFYRRKGAYLVGRARGGNRVMPLLLALVHEADGIRVDAALLTEDEVSVVFSFTRSYFRADIPCPTDAIEFLRTLMPLKPVFELYTALGHHKHGKTEFYRALQRHLMRTSEKFARTPGVPGMVMEVFALPTFEAVFKVIRDEFPPPKHLTPAEVRRRYKMVFAHDRAGRLVDAQEYQGLAFPRDRFAPALLAELLETAGRSVRVEGDRVVIAHLYAERKVRPLDLYMEESPPATTVAAALDYGQAIRDLASTGIFPGDLLPKNFGVTRSGRVVFYDYDELRLLEECRFRDLPEPRNPEEELADEPWFHIGANDVFPVDLARFVPFSGAARAAYLAAHGRIYDTPYWQDLQARQAAGEVVDIFPYDQARRLSR